MKKRVKVVVVLCALLMLMAIPVMAAELPALEPDADGKYTATYSEATAGNQYVLLVIKGGTGLSADNLTGLTADQITYIDQAAAGSTGGVTFAGFIPRTLPNSTVFISGTNLPATPIGFINGVGIEVTGTVKVVGVPVAGIKVALGSGTNDAFSATYSAETDATGAFVISSVPEANDYALKISKQYYVPYYKGTVAVSDSDSDGEVALLDGHVLYGGDLDESGSVTASDLGTFISDFGKTTGLLCTGSNIDAAGAVTATDLGLLISSFGKSAIVE